MSNIPNATAPKGGNDFISYDAFPESGPATLTILSVEFVPNFETTDRETGERLVFDALQFTYGAETSAGARFVKPWPIKYSIHEKAGYSKLYKAAKGTLPLPGSNPAELVGLGVQADLDNENKTSKKGTAYTRTKILSFSAVHPKLKGDIAPLASLLPKLANASKPKGDQAKAGAKGDEDGPF